MKLFIGILIGLCILLLNFSLLVFSAFLWAILNLQLQAAWVFIVIYIIDIFIGMTWWEGQSK